MDANLATAKRARDMPIYKRYYDLIANGTKTIEVRVAYTSMLRIKPGSQIRFTCRDETTLTRVKRVARYSSFEEMFDHESANAINTTAGRTEQLRAIRDIFPRRRSPWACWPSRSRRCDPMADDTGLARPRRILTVCKGNHCRAPLAAAVLAKHGGSAVETAPPACATGTWESQPTRP